MKNFTSLLFAMFFASLLYTQDACMQFPVSLEERVENANLIIEGKVVKEYSKWNASKTMIHTYYDIQPTTLYKGKPQATITLQTQGGTIGNDKIIVEPSLELNVNDAGVFFLQKASDNVFTSYAVNQGAFIYDYSKDEATSLFDSFNLSSAKLDNEVERLTRQAPKTLTSTSLKIVTTNTSAFNTTASGSTATITDLSHSVIDAGMDQVLTITGSGFGSERGEQRIGFANADTGGKSFMYPTMGYKSWSDNKVEVIVPNKAGSGHVVFYTGSEIADTSAQQIKVNFNRKTAGYVGSYYPIRLVNRSGLGGYSITVNNALRNNSEAFLRMKEALAQWSVHTGINWDVNSITTDNATTNRDGENNISFKPQADIGAGVLGATVTHTSGCRDANDNIFFYVDEMDMYYSEDINWNFSKDEPSNTQFDFYTVVLHEFGHAHQVGHVIDYNSVMHYSASKGRSKREFTPEEAEGAKGIVTMSMEDIACANYTAMQPMKTAIAANLEYDSCNNYFEYGKEIQANKWHYVTNDNNELVFQFNPRGNDISNISIKIYVDTPSSSDTIVTTDRQFEINALNAQGNVVELTEPMDIRLIYSKEEIEYVMNTAGVTSLSELAFLKNDSSCGEAFDPNTEQTELTMTDFGLGGSESFVLETRVDGFSSFFGTTNQSSILPVTWGDFYAEQEASVVKLFWSTLTEVQTSHFNVERSQDGINWEVVNTQNGAGFSNEQLFYSFDDNKAYKGENYYRIHQIDTTGSNEYSTIIRVDFTGNNDSVSYQNGALKFALSNRTDLSLYSIGGQLVHNENIAQNETVNVAHLAKGTYIVVCQSGSDKEVFKVAIH